MISALIAAFVLAFSGTGAAQDDYHSAEPIRTVVAFMSAFAAQDADAMSGYLADDAVVAMVEELDGPDRVRVLQMSQLVETIGGSQSSMREPIWNIRGFEDGPVAVVTANFEFLVDDTLSHCGVNIFTLMRIEGEWKIATVTYSHIADDCTAGS